MALDYSVLQGLDPAGAFFRGQEAVRAEQERNMLRQMQMEQMAAQRQRQQFEFEQAQEDRRRRMEQEGQFRQLADLVRQHGLDPDDPKVLGQFSQAALMSGQPQLASFVTSMADRAAKRREIAAENARIGAILSPQAGQPVAPQNAMARPAPMVNALAAPQQDLLAGTPFAIEPMAAPPRAAVAPAPAAPADNAARIAQLESQRDALEALGTPRALTEAKRIDRQLERLVPKAPAASSIAEYRFAQTPEGGSFKGSYQDFLASKQPKPVQVNVKPPEQERAERGERGKLLVAEYKGVSDAARLAARTLPALETQERVLDSGFKTGFGAEVQKTAASVLSALGVPEATKFATDAQTFLAATQQAVLQRQLEQKGPQTEADAQRITQTGAQLGNTPEANRFIIAVAKAQLQRDIAQRNFYDAWWKKNKTYDGAEDAWFSGDGGKSLFDNPALKQFAAPAKPAAAAPAASGSWRVVR